MINTKIRDLGIINHVNWKAIRGMRNVVAHHYGYIDADILWETSIMDIKEIKIFCEKILGPFLEKEKALTE